MNVVLEIANLGFAHGKHRVLSDISLRFLAGDYVALVGPNGAGKSTLLRCCAGILQGATGSIRIAGHGVGHDPVAARRHLGLAVDPNQLPGLLTGREVLSLWAHGRGLGDIPGSTLQLAESWLLAPMLDRRVDQYSLGTRQKLGILVGLMGEPPLLLLDEPLNGLDPRSALALKVELQRRAEQGACVVLATHALEVAERFVNRAILLVEGAVQAEWGRSDIDAIRDHPTRSLEESMASAMA
ncbi:ATP-binding cassette domain-containing protein [Cognatiluteimonas telluris]|uniref:ATP-binding cassette domain-containing protein n=1 Tax=Cognatiluteimonas telluris TaxID=1104775 RepID=UPI00140CA4B9|nr:ABC transporter ATP-binding protein [Lysobacter telluris]